MKDILAGAGVLLVLGSVMLATRLFKSHLSAESARKIVHISMGCTALTFPFVFEYRQSVVILGGIAALMLLFLRLNKGLRTSVGSPLFGVKRKSLGELYYIFSIMIVFVLHQSVVEYLIPILVLTFADSLAALVGTSYGRNSLSGEHEDRKSAEGSVMFFITAFICVLIPLQFMDDIGSAKVLVISLLIGLLAAMIEAVSKNGNDNLLLPLLVYGFLRYNLNQTLDTMVINLCAMMFFLMVVLFVYEVTGTSKLSIAYALLVGYIVMIQGGFFWIIPPLAMIMTFGTMPMMKDEEKQTPIPYQVVEANSLIGLACLWASVFFPQYLQTLYIAFSLSFACHLMLASYHRFINYVNFRHVPAMLCGLAKSVVFIALPTLLITRMNWLLFILYLTCLAIAVLPGLILQKRFNCAAMSIAGAKANEALVGITVVGFFVMGRLI